MREYMTNIGAITMIIALANMIIPDGGMKKFASLAMGFMLITAALSFIPGSMADFSLSSQSFSISDEDIEALQAEYRADVLKQHRENMEKIIGEKLKNGGSVHVETSPDGDITRVTLRVRGDESEAVLYITQTLGTPRERIKLIYDKN